MTVTTPREKEREREKEGEKIKRGREKERMREERGKDEEEDRRKVNTLPLNKKAYIEKIQNRNEFSSKETTDVEK